MRARIARWIWRRTRPCSWLWHRYEAIRGASGPLGPIIQCRYCYAAFPLQVAVPAYSGACPTYRYDGLKCDLPFGHAGLHYNRYGGFPFQPATDEELERLRRFRIIPGGRQESK